MLLRAVFDVNVLFSAFGWGGVPDACLRLAQGGQVISITCPEIVADFEQKLVSKLGRSIAEAAKAANDIRSFSQLVTILHMLHVVTADPDDDVIIECAVVGGATHIVTGDKKHLLPLGSYQGIQIVSPADFLALVPTP